MIPLGDDNSSRKNYPVITYVLIALNVIFFFLEVAGGEQFLKQWAFIPQRFLTHPFADSITIFTSMFMHAGLGHLIGNMIYLWIFGDNVEDRMGKVPFLALYLVCGILATFSQMAFDPSSTIPSVGASGAIAGLLGSYLFLFPYGKVDVLLGMHVVQIPALIVIGFWFFLQFISSMNMGEMKEGEGGIAYMAHIGGFIAGLAITVFYFRLWGNK